MRVPVQKTAVPSLLIGLIFFILATGVIADEIIKKNGVSITGSIVEEAENYVVIDIGFSRLQINRDEISEIKKSGNISVEELEGDVAYNEGRFLDALRLYRRALEGGIGEANVREKIRNVERAIEQLVNKQIGEVIQRARQLVEQRQFETAEQIISEAIDKIDDEILKERLTQEKAYIHTQKAEMYLDAINYRDAEVELKTAISIVPDYCLAHFKLAELYLRNPALTDDAIREFQETLKCADDDLTEAQRAEVLFNLAELFFAKGQYPESTKYYREVIESNHSDLLQKSKKRLEETYIKMAQDTAQTNPEETLLLLRSALEMNPNNIQARLQIADIAKQTNKIDEAIFNYEEILKIDPKYPDVHYQLALAYLEKGLFDSALQELRKELFVNPQNYNAQCKLGELYIAAGQPDKAMPLFNNAIETNPEKFRAYLGLGIAYWKRGETTKAKENFQRVLTINPRHRQALFYMASIYKDEKNYLGAEDLFHTIIEQLREEKSLTKEQRDMLVDSYIKYGEVELLLDRPRTAIEHFENALIYNPNAPEAFFGIGQSNVKLTRYRQAEQNYQKAIKIAPKDPRYYLGLGILYHNFLKELDKAVENYQKYIELGGPDKLTVNKWIMECGGKPVFTD